MEKIIRAENLKYNYITAENSITEALRGIDLEVQKGEFLAILGHNGSGKSTLSRHMNGIFAPTEGKMYVDGMDTADENLIFDVRKTVSMVFQNPDNQIVEAVVEDDVAFALENLGVEPSEIRKRVDEALKAVGMYEFRKHAPHLLSGGQKQRIAIAGVIAVKPSVVVMDEPTAMLDPRGRREVMEVIDMLCKKQKITVILVTHHMDEAARADRIIVMNKGLILTEGTPSEIFRKRDVLEAVGLSLPQTIELISDLNAEGANLPLDGLSVEDCTDILAKYLNSEV